MYDREVQATKIDWRKTVTVSDPMKVKKLKMGGVIVVVVVVTVSELEWVVGV